MSIKRPKKYKLLLDEGLHLPKSYPATNAFYDLKHISQTKYRARPDIDIFNLANNESRFPVVFNTKDFKPLIIRKKMSVIALSTNLTDKDADLKISKALRELSPSQEKGYLISISKSGVAIKIPNS
ncbi:MAG: DUF5615 family PIN-like protein [Candidatus Daviesbacteria bacterium]|nr:DUF5615 family PIN-like protein [Candidatus Daviesbacteria bacterium]